MADSRISRRLCIARELSVKFLFGIWVVLQLGEELYHRFRSSGSLASAVELGADAACVSLFLVLDKQYFMNHGSNMLDGHLLQAGADGFCDQISVLGFSSNDEAQGDHSLWLFLSGKYGGTGYRDFKSSRNADNIHSGVWHDGCEFIFGILNEGIGKLFIVLGSDNADASL